MPNLHIDKSLLSYKTAFSDVEKRKFSTIAIRYKLYINGWSLRGYMEHLRYSDNYMDYEISLCYYNNTPVGVCVLCKPEDNIVMFFVRESYRRNGIGTELMRITTRSCNNFHGSQYGTQMGKEFFNALQVEMR